MKTKIKRLSAALCAAAVLFLTLAVGFGGTSPPYSEAARKELSAGVQNIVKRAYQMTEIKWTPKKDIYAWGKDFSYKAGTTYKGLPYGQPVNASYVPWYTSLDGFIAAVNDPDSKMYTATSEYLATAPYYSVDCSAFVSWAWQLPSRQTTRTIANYASLVSTFTYAGAEVGDCLCLAGSHVVLITDITYNSGGDINGIEISEATVNGASSYCCQRTRYGEGGAYTLSQLQEKYFGAGYILYRSLTREGVAYTHCCAVPLEGDECEKCGVGCKHSYTSSVTAAPTCVKEGVKTFTCTLCGKSYTEAVPVIAHNYGEWSTEREATCAAEGLEAASCSVCGRVMKRTTPKNGSHIFSVVSTVPAGCETDGSVKEMCTLCGETVTKTLAATGHLFINGKCERCLKSEASVIRGDINDDGVISSADAVLLAQHLAELTSLTGGSAEAADVNADGVISSADAVLLAQYLAELIRSFG